MRAEGSYSKLCCNLSKDKRCFMLGVVKVRSSTGFKISFRLVQLVNNLQTKLFLVR